MHGRPFTRYAGARIRIIRGLKGLSQAQLAVRMTVITEQRWTVTKISRFETGDRGLDLEQLGAFALALGQDLHAFLPAHLADAMA